MENDRNLMLENKQYSKFCSALRDKEMFCSKES